jgi:methionine biosynthesis protein MetW
MKGPAEPKTPDRHAGGFVEGDPDACRYDDPSYEPDEAPELLAKLMPRGAKVLDIGCGTGSLTIAATQGKDARVIAIEPDPQRAALARSRGLEVICGTAEPKLLKKLGPFDAIILADVIEHLPDPAELLRELAAVLSPGGRILASVPNIAHWTVRLKLLIGKFDYQRTGIMDATHLRWFTAYSLRMLFIRCGYEVVSMRATAGAWMPEYTTFPLGLVPERPRAALVRKLARGFPRLFGCQFIVQAKLAGSQ